MNYVPGYCHLEMMNVYELNWIFNFFYLRENRAMINQFERRKMRRSMVFIERIVNLTNFSQHPMRVNHQENDCMPTKNDTRLIFVL